MPKQGANAAVNKNFAVQPSGPGSYRTADFTVNMSAQEPVPAQQIP